MKIFKFISIIVFLLTFNNLKPLIVGAEIYVRKVCNSARFLIPLHDWHTRQQENDQNYTQRQSFIANIKKLQEKYGHDSVLVITEDTTHFTKDVFFNDTIRNRNNQKRADKILKEDEQNCIFIVGLTHLCLHNSIPTINVECRQLVDNYWDLETRVKTINTQVEDTLKYKLREIQTEYNRTKEIILSYKDEITLTHWYQSKIFEFDTLLKGLLDRNTNSYTDLIRLYREYWDCITELLNFKILHTINQNKQVKFIFVCAGGWHNKMNSNFYIDMDYQRIRTYADPINNQNRQLLDKFVNNVGNEQTQNDILHKRIPINIEHFFGIINHHAHNLRWKMPRPRCSLTAVLGTGLAALSMYCLAQLRHLM